MPYADYQQRLRLNRERQKTESGKAAHARANKAYRQRNRKKLAAHNAISKGILRGKILPMTCIVCGKKAEAHHPDYDAPLDVVWLCPDHHREVHKLAKERR